GESVDFSFSIAVPDDLEGLEANDVYNSFTIRQLPVASAMNDSQSVPEPSTMFGFIGLMGFALVKSKVKSRS
ncbi:MAG: PEP-CTERM sorting domain-containing protein, partial [Cyanobacteriota bacterium]|nr:PEP-CTERM sorting domain-containing protein [Cyanobacteriota bacterium]